MMSVEPCFTELSDGERKGTRTKNKRRSREEEEKKSRRRRSIAYQSASASCHNVSTFALVLSVCELTTWYVPWVVDAVSLP